MAELAVFRDHLMAHLQVENQGHTGPLSSAFVSAVPTEEQLRRITLFRRLSVAARARIADVSRTVTFERGAHVFAEGDTADAFLSIAEGRVKVFKSTPAGKELILEIFGTGDPLGAVAVYESVPYPASAVALEHTTCVRIPGARSAAVSSCRWCSPGRSSRTSPAPPSRPRSAS